MRGRLVIAAMLMALAVTAFGRPAEQPKPADAVLAEAQKTAKSAKKNVFLMFDASW